MKLRVVSNDEPPPPPESRWGKSKAGAIIALVILAAIAGGIWQLSHWFSEPVSGSYLRQQSAGFNECQKRALNFETRPITRYVLYRNRSICDDVQSEAKAMDDQRDALGNVQ